MKGLKGNTPQLSTSDAVGCS